MYLCHQALGHLLWLIVYLPASTYNGKKWGLECKLLLARARGMRLLPPRESQGEMPSPGGTLLLPPSLFCSWSTHTSLSLFSFFK